MDRPHPNHIRQSVFYINNYSLVVSRLAVSTKQNLSRIISKAVISQYATDQNLNNFLL
jgi:hypothetical protein